MWGELEDDGLDMVCGRERGALPGSPETGWGITEVGSIGAGTGRGWKSGAIFHGVRLRCPLNAPMAVWSRPLNV